MGEKTDGTSPVGEVVEISGLAFKETDSGSVVLKKGSPVFQDSVIVTRDKSNVQLRFLEHSYLSQGEDSHSTIDEYTLYSVFHSS